jgi:hypothetical protein
MDLPHLGNLPVLQGAAQIVDPIGSGINEFIMWQKKILGATMTIWKNLGLHGRNTSIILSKLLWFTKFPVPKGLPKIWHKLANF